ncbi:Conserved_hypothetical protein [Hexamita inflata]|uniref:Uncharacterized protein n=1 Tax=Hexamita inflata TaxID=28002 RepID=A0AA86NTI3_9EUKA|nr:Conserved hypothetical protein [Hexamita inflata]
MKLQKLQPILKVEELNDAYAEITNERQSRMQSRTRNQPRDVPRSPTYEIRLNQQIQNIAEGELTTHLKRELDFDKILTESAMVPNAVEMYVKVAAEILEVVDKFDPSSSFNLNRIIQFLVSNARMTPAEMVALQQKIYQLEEQIQTQARDFEIQEMHAKKQQNHIDSYKQHLQQLQDKYNQLAEAYKKEVDNSKSLEEQLKRAISFSEELKEQLIGRGDVNIHLTQQTNKQLSQNMQLRLQLEEMIKDNNRYKEEVVIVKELNQQYTEQLAGTSDKISSHQQRVEQESQKIKQRNVQLVAQVQDLEGTLETQKVKIESDYLKIKKLEEKQEDLLIANKQLDQFNFELKKQASESQKMNQIISKQLADMNQVFNKAFKKNNELTHESSESDTYSDYYSDESYYSQSYSDYSYSDDSEYKNSPTYVKPSISEMNKQVENEIKLKKAQKLPRNKSLVLGGKMVEEVTESKLYASKSAVCIPPMNSIGSGINLIHNDDSNQAENDIQSGKRHRSHKQRHKRNKDDSQSEEESNQPETQKHRRHKQQKHADIDKPEVEITDMEYKPSERRHRTKHSKKNTESTSAPRERHRKLHKSQTSFESVDADRVQMDERSVLHSSKEEKRTSKHKTHRSHEPLQNEIVLTQEEIIQVQNMTEHEQKAFYKEKAKQQKQIVRQQLLISQFNANPDDIIINDYNAPDSDPHNQTTKHRNSTQSTKPKSPNINKLDVPETIYKQYMLIKQQIPQRSIGIQVQAELKTVYTICRNCQQHVEDDADLEVSSHSESEKDEQLIIHTEQNILSNNQKAKYLIAQLEILSKSGNSKYNQDQIYQIQKQLNAISQKIVMEKIRLQKLEQKNQITIPHKISNKPLKAILNQMEHSLILSKVDGTVKSYGKTDGVAELNEKQAQDLQSLTTEKYIKANIPQKAQKQYKAQNINKHANTDSEVPTISIQSQQLPQQSEQKNNKQDNENSQDDILNIKEKSFDNDQYIDSNNQIHDQTLSISSNVVNAPQRIQSPQRVSRKLIVRTNNSNSSKAKSRSPSPLNQSVVTSYEKPKQIQTKSDNKVNDQPSQSKYVSPQKVYAMIKKHLIQQQNSKLHKPTVIVSSFIDPKSIKSIGNELVKDNQSTIIQKILDSFNVQSVQFDYDNQELQEPDVSNKEPKHQNVLHSSLRTIPKSESQQSEIKMKLMDLISSQAAIEQQKKNIQANKTTTKEYDYQQGVFVSPYSDVLKLRKMKKKLSSQKNQIKKIINNIEQLEKKQNIQVKALRFDDVQSIQKISPINYKLPQTTQLKTILDFPIQQLLTPPFVFYKFSSSNAFCDLKYQNQINKILKYQERNQNIIISDKLPNNEDEFKQIEETTYLQEVQNKPLLEINQFVQLVQYSFIEQLGQIIKLDTIQCQGQDFILLSPNIQIRELSWTESISSEIYYYFKNEILSSYDVEVDILQKFCALTATKYGLESLGQQQILQTIVNILNYRHCSFIVELAYILLFGSNKNMKWLLVFLVDNISQQLSVNNFIQLSKQLFPFSQMQRAALKSQVQNEGQKVDGKQIEIVQELSIVKFVYQFELLKQARLVQILRVFNNIQMGGLINREQQYNLLSICYPTIDLNTELCQEIRDQTDIADFIIVLQSLSRFNNVTKRRQVLELIGQILTKIELTVKNLQKTVVEYKVRLKMQEETMKAKIDPQQLDQSDINEQYKQFELKMSENKIIVRDIDQIQVQINESISICHKYLDDRKHQIVYHWLNILEILIGTLNLMMQ